MHDEMGRFFNLTSLIFTKTYTLFLKGPIKLKPRLAVLKIFLILGYIVLNLLLFFPDIF